MVKNCLNFYNSRKWQLAFAFEENKSYEDLKEDIIHYGMDCLRFQEINCFNIEKIFMMMMINDDGCEMTYFGKSNVAVRMSCQRFFILKKLVKEENSNVGDIVGVLLFFGKEEEKEDAIDIRWNI